MRNRVLTLAAGLACLIGCSFAQQQPAGQINAEQRFQQLDRNRDDKLTPQELPEEWFVRLDANRDSVVTLEEAWAALAAARPATGGAAPSGGMPASGSLWRDAIDPELLQHEALMTYQDSAGTILLEHLDPATGSADPGKPGVALDSGAAPQPPPPGE